MNNKNALHKNRGMLLEQIINKTINYYLLQKIAYFFKKNLDIVFSKIDSNNKLNNSFISKKSTVDYYGIYKGRFIAFEAKSTDESTFHLSNIKMHQHNHLKMIQEMGGLSFYIIMFKKDSKIFIVYPEQIQDIQKKSFTLEEAKEIFCSVDITFPGIIDFLNIINI